MKFEWDAEKNKGNLEKHKISFEDALRVFLGSHITLELDCDDEQRFAAIGTVDSKFFTLNYTMRGKKIRIISARSARTDEEEYYEKIFGNR